MALLSMTKYAAHRGVTVEAVSKAVKRGRITCERNARGHAQIDPEVADREWAENSSTTSFRYSQSKPLGGEPGEDRQTLVDAEAELKKYKAKIAKLEYEEQSGKLVDAEEVKAKWLSVASIVRTKVLGIPSKARQRIPETTSEQYLALEAIVRETLEELSDIGSESEEDIDGDEL